MRKRGFPKGTKLGPRPKKPNIRQMKAIAIMKSGKAKTRKEALMMAGYTESTANASSAMMKNKSWAQLIDEYLPDSLLAQKHSDLLIAKKTYTDRSTGSLHESEYVDHAIVDRALDMAYKLKGRYKTDVSITFRDRLGKLSNEELDGVIKAISSGEGDVAQGIIDNPSGEVVE